MKLRKEKHQLVIFNGSLYVFNQLNKGLRLLYSLFVHFTRFLPFSRCVVPVTISQVCHTFEVVFCISCHEINSTNSRQKRTVLELCYHSAELLISGECRNFMQMATLTTQYTVVFTVRRQPSCFASWGVIIIWQGLFFFWFT